MINKISFVSPIYNEEDNILELYKEICSVASENGYEYEIILVDDGSRDKSLDKLKSLHRQDDHVRVLSFMRNFGQTAAMAAGFDYAVGDVVVTLDADLQNDPRDIPKLIKKINEGYDVVSGWRKNRKEPLLTRRLPSQTANRIIGAFTGVKINDYGCTLKAYRKEVIKDLNLYGEMHRFIPALCSWRGAKITEIVVNDRPRKHGESKYGISRTGRVVLDLLTVKFLLDYATKPMQIFGKLGFWSLLLGFVALVAVIVMKLAINFDMTGNPLLMIGVLFILVGIQLMVLGLLAEINIRTYHESQNKPIYKIKTEL